MRSEMRSEMKKDLRKSLLLYGITDRSWLGDRSLFEAVRDSIDGGVTFVRLREKNLDERPFYEEAERMQRMAKVYEVPFVVNDNVDIAIRMNADGVHVGQTDMDVAAVREIIGEEKILGVSVQTVEQALEAERLGADYLGVGAVFPTSSKDDAIDVSLETLKAICDAVSIPVVANGGMNVERIAKLAGTGISGVAVISSIFAQSDTRKAASELRRAVEKIVP